MILVFLVALGFILNCLESTQYFPIIIFLRYLILSRISYFSTGYGPYAHLNSYYRGVYENVPATDSLLVDFGAPLFDKFYCSSDLHIKYKTRLFNKDLYLFH